MTDEIGWRKIDLPKQVGSKWHIVFRDAEGVWLATIECDTEDEAEEALLSHILGEIDLLEDEPHEL